MAINVSRHSRVYNCRLWTLLHEKYVSNIYVELIMPSKFHCNLSETVQSTNIFTLISQTLSTPVYPLQTLRVTVTSLVGQAVKLQTNISGFVDYRNTVRGTKIHVYSYCSLKKGIFISFLNMSHSPKIYLAVSIIYM